MWKREDQLTRKVFEKKKVNKELRKSSGLCNQQKNLSQMIEIGKTKLGKIK